MPQSGSSIKQSIAPYTTNQYMTLLPIFCFAMINIHIYHLHHYTYLILASIQTPLDISCLNKSVYLVQVSISLMMCFQCMENKQYPHRLFEKSFSILFHFFCALPITSNKHCIKLIFIPCHHFVHAFLWHLSTYLIPSIICQPLLKGYNCLFVLICNKVYLL